MLWRFPDTDPFRMSPLALAYIGDAVFELYVRTHMAAKETKVDRLHRGTVGLVSAKAMATYYAMLEPLLSDIECDVLRRGRNVKTHRVKSAGVGQYHKSTGFEALVGYLFLSGQEERLEELLGFLLDETPAMGEKNDTEEDKPFWRGQAEETGC